MFKRFENSAGRFWEIEQEQCEVMVCFGKIGKVGTQQYKLYSSETEAFVNYQRRIRDKEKKGYQAVFTQKENLLETKILHHSELINPEYENAINLDPDNDRFILEYGIWQQRQGLARGSLTSLLAQKDCNIEQLNLFMKKYGKELVGRFSEVIHRIAQVKEKEPLELAGHHIDPPIPIVFDWHYGYIRSARLAFEGENKQLELQNFKITSLYDSKTGENLVLKEFLGLDSAKRLRNLTLGGFDFENLDYTIEVKMLANCNKLQNLEGLFIGDYYSFEAFWSSIKGIGALAKNYPNLHFLKLHANQIEINNLDFPKLRKLVLQTSGFSGTALKALAKNNCPLLDHLEFKNIESESYEAECTLYELGFLLNATNFTNLKYLALKNVEFRQDFLTALFSSPLLAQLEVLDLSQGMLGDAQISPFLQNAKSFTHLQLLDLSENILEFSIPDLENFSCPVNLDGQNVNRGFYDTIEE